MDLVLFSDAHPERMNAKLLSRKETIVNPEYLLQIISQVVHSRAKLSFAPNPLSPRGGMKNITEKSYQGLVALYVRE